MESIYSKMTDSQPLGVRMKRERQRRGLTQIQAANEAGVGLNTWRDFEQGALKPTSVYLPIIERWVLGV